VAEFLSIVVGAALVNNLVLVQVLGVSFFFSNTNKIQNAASLGLLSGGVIFCSSLFNFLVFRLILTPLGLQFLQLLAFVFISSCLTCALIIRLNKHFPFSFRRHGLSMLMVGGNSAVIGVSLLVNNANRGFSESFAYSLGAASGFALVLVLFAALKERLETSDVPLPFKGLAVDLISAGLVAMAFLGFAGTVK